MNVNHKGPRPRSCSISPESRHVYFLSTPSPRYVSEATVARGMYLTSPDQSFENLGVVFQKAIIPLPFCVRGSCRMSRHLSSRFSWALVNIFRHVCNSWKGRSAVPRRRSESGRLPWFGPVLTMSAIGSRFGLAGENLPYFRSVACFRFCDGRFTCFILSVLFEVVMRAS